MPFGGAIGRYLAIRAGKKAPSRVSVEGVKKKVGEEASRLEGPKGFRGGAVKMLGGTTSTPGRQESAKRLRTWNAGGLGAMKGMQSTRGHLPQSSKNQKLRAEVARQGAALGGGGVTTAHKARLKQYGTGQAPSRVSVEGVKKKVGEEASRLEGPKGFRGGAVKMLGGTTSTPGRQESAKRLRTWNAGGLGAMKGMQSTRGHLPQSSKPGAKLEKSQHAYDVGYAVGMLKSGSVERVEKQNAKLFKIAQLLQRKGKLTKIAEGEGLVGDGLIKYNPSWWSDLWNGQPGGASPDTSSLEYQKNLSDEVARQGAALGGGGVNTESKASLKSYGRTGNLGLTTPKPQAKEAPDGKIDDKNVISLDMDPVKRRRIQQRGVEGARRGLGGDGADGGMSGEEAGFYGGPKFGDIRRYYMQLLGMTPSQLSARDMAQEVGRGRAWRSRGDRNWLREMLG